MKQQAKFSYRVLAAVLTFTLLMPLLFVPIEAEAASADSALREAITKNARTYSLNMAVRNDGTAMFKGEILEGWTNVASIAISMSDLDNPIALRWDGTVLTWNNDPVVSQWRDIIGLYSFEDEIIGLRLDGTVVSSNPSSKLTAACKTWTNVEKIQLPAFTLSLFAITKDGKALCSNDSFDLSSWTDLVQISGGWGTVAGLRRDGTVLYADTQNGTKILDGWTDVVAVGSYGYVMALRSDGTILTDADTLYGTPLDFSGWNTLVSIDVYGYDYIGVKADGTVIATGEFAYGGKPDLSGWNNIVDAKSDGYSIVGLRTDGTVLAWNGKDTSVIFSNVQLPYHSSQSLKKPSEEDLSPFGAVIVYPKEKSYLPDYKSRFVKTGNEDSIPVYWDPDNAKSKRMYVLSEGDIVTVLAEQSGFSCVIFTDTSGKNQVGWVSSSDLTSTAVQPSNGPSEKDLTPFGSVIVYPKSNSYLSNYEIRYVKVPQGNSISVYWDPDNTNSKRVYVLYEGDMVTVLAQQGGLSCVIFTDTSGKKQVGWVFSDCLTGTVVHPSKKPGNEDLIPFGPVIAEPKDTSYLTDYETGSVKAPDGKSIPVYWDPDNADSKRMYVLYEGDNVTVLARQGNHSCVIFTDTSGKNQVGWVSTDCLVMERPDGYLGVTVSTHYFFGIPVGVSVEDVDPGYCAAKAGLKTEDLIFSVGTHKVKTVDDFTEELHKFKAGDTISITVSRFGAELTFNITLDKKP